MALFTRETSRLELNTVKENGKKTRMILGQILMKENMKMIPKINLACLHGRQGIAIEENLSTRRDKASERCAGQTAQSTWDNGSKAYKMDMER